MAKPLYASDADRRLLKAAHGRSQDSIWALVHSHGASVHARDSNGRTALFNVECYHARFLIEKGADPNARDKKGRTPIYMRASDSSRRTYLVEAGADVNVQDRAGATPLHVAIEEGREAVAAHLIVLGATPSFFLRDKRDRIPMIVADECWGPGSFPHLRQLYEDACARDLDRGLAQAAGATGNGGRLRM
ncbi:MAG TPA: ankyrin repeat domain-containing protein [Hyphomonadaceae bacterium]|nr:ankyrin repeat domain-containing protein [Hyphomonadaceae bacterium]